MLFAKLSLCARARHAFMKPALAFCVWLQASYHGFGVIVKPEKLVQGHGKPLQEAVQRVLADPFYKVSNYPMLRKSIIW